MKKKIIFWLLRILGYYPYESRYEQVVVLVQNPWCFHPSSFLTKKRKTYIDVDYIKIIIENKQFGLKLKENK